MSTVRFLADHDLNEHIVESVRRREPGIEFLRVRDLGLKSHPDSEILAYAHRNPFILMAYCPDSATLIVVF